MVAGADRPLLNVSGEPRDWGRGVVGSQGGQQEEDRRREDGDWHFVSEEEDMGSPIPFCVQAPTSSNDSYLPVGGQHSDINQSGAESQARASSAFPRSVWRLLLSVTQHLTKSIDLNYP